MRKNTLRITATLFMMLVATLGCVKTEKGDTGPQGTTGPRGEQGIQGEKGDKGDNGLNGTNGNANVKTRVATIIPSNWAYDATNYFNYVNVNDVDITADIVNSGLVSVFYSFVSGEWSALPETNYFSDGTSYTMTFNYSVGRVQLQIVSASFTTTTVNVDTYVKIVTIASSVRKANPNVDWNDYNQVKPFIGNGVNEVSVALNN